jgi:hypothetical protein
MQTNNSFSLSRFMMLIKQSLIINKNIIAISLAQFTGTVFLLLLLGQRIKNFQWENQNYMNFFIFLFIILGMFYSSLSFPAFRSKEKSITYLMLPSSRSEKFIFEFLVRLLLFILFLPLIFWLIANAEGAIVHQYVPRFINYKFVFREGITEIVKRWNLGGWGVYTTIQFFLFILIANFAGACHFTKSTLIKTLLTISGIACGYILLAFLLFKGLHLSEYQPAQSGILFPGNNKEMIIVFALGATIVNLSLITIAWFRFKEKEA